MSDGRTSDGQKQPPSQARQDLGLSGASPISRISSQALGSTAGGSIQVDDSRQVTWDPSSGRDRSAAGPGSRQTSIDPWRQAGGLGLDGGGTPLFPPNPVLEQLLRQVVELRERHDAAAVAAERRHRELLAAVASLRPARNAPPPRPAAGAAHPPPAANGGDVARAALSGGMLSLPDGDLEGSVRRQTGCAPPPGGGGGAGLLEGSVMGWGAQPMGHAAELSIRGYEHRPPPRRRRRQRGACGGITCPPGGGDGGGGAPPTPGSRASQSPRTERPHLGRGHPPYQRRRGTNASNATYTTRADTGASARRGVRLSVHSVASNRGRPRSPVAGAARDSPTPHDPDGDADDRKLAIQVRGMGNCGRADQLMTGQLTPDVPTPPPTLPAGVKPLAGFTSQASPGAAKGQASPASPPGCNRDRGAGFAAMSGGGLGLFCGGDSPPASPRLLSIPSQAALKCSAALTAGTQSPKLTSQQQLPPVLLASCEDAPSDMPTPSALAADAEHEFQSGWSLQRPSGIEGADATVMAEVQQSLLRPGRSAMLLPDSAPRQIADVVAMLLTAAEIFLVLVALARGRVGWDEPPETWQTLVHAGGSAYFAFMVWLGFHTCILAGSALIGDEPGEVAELQQRYRKGWMGFDVVAALPADLMAWLAGSPQLGRTLSLVRLLRVVRLPTYLRNSNPLEGRVFWARFLLSALSVILVILSAACLCMVLEVDEAGMSLHYWDRFYRSFYFVTITFTTVGFGDIAPTSPLHMLVTAFIVLFGTVGYAWVLGEVSLLVSHESEYERQVSNRKRLLSSVLRHYSVPVSVQREAFEVFPQIVEESIVDNAQVLGALPLQVRAKIEICVRIDYLRGVEMLRHVSPACLVDLAGATRERSLSPDDLVFDKGDDAEELYVIFHGIVQVLDDDGRARGEFGPRAWFGDMCILPPPHEKPPQRTCPLACETRCQVFVLHREAFHLVLQQHPKDAATLGVAAQPSPVGGAAWGAALGMAADPAPLSTHSSPSALATSPTSVPPSRVLPVSPTTANMSAKRAMRHGGPATLCTDTLAESCALFCAAPPTSMSGSPHGTHKIGFPTSGRRPSPLPGRGITRVCSAVTAGSPRQLAQAEGEPPELHKAQTGTARTWQSRSEQQGLGWVSPSWRKRAGQVKVVASAAPSTQQSGSNRTPSVSITSARSGVLEGDLRFGLAPASAKQTPQQNPLVHGGALHGGGLFCSSVGPEDTVSARSS